MIKVSFLSLLVFGFLGLTLWGCGPIERGQVYGEIDFKTQGTRIEEVDVDEGILVVNRAELAFGPLYLCSGLQAGHLCETARLEFVESKIIDLLDDQEVTLGQLTGMSGLVQSWMFDLGIVSTRTHSKPVVLESARDLGGHSFVLEGTLTFQGRSIPLTIATALSQSDTTEQGVSLIRKSQSESFRYTITKEQILGKDQRSMLMRFQFKDWLEILNFNRDLTAEKLDSLCPTSNECEEWVVEEESTLMRQVKTTLLTQMRPRFEYK